MRKRNLWVTVPGLCGQRAAQGHAGQQTPDTANTVRFKDLITSTIQLAGTEARETFDNLLSRSNQTFAVGCNGEIYVAPNSR